jgi:hypothetical protein
MSSKKIVVIAAWLVIGVSSVIIYGTVIGWPLRINPRPHQALGEMLANESLKLLGPGGRIGLMARETEVFKNPAHDIQLMRFHRVIGKAGVKVAFSRLVKVDPLRVAAVPVGELFQLLKKASDVDVVVSYLGAPQWTDKQLAELGEKRPKIVAVCLGVSVDEIRRLFQRKAFDVAIIDRRNPAHVPPKSNDTAAWFDYLYEVVRATEASPESGAKN